MTKQISNGSRSGLDLTPTPSRRRRKFNSSRDFRKAAKLCFEPWRADAGFAPMLTDAAFCEWAAIGRVALSIMQQSKADLAAKAAMPEGYEMFAKAASEIDRVAETMKDLVRMMQSAEARLFVSGAAACVANGVELR